MTRLTRTSLFLLFVTIIVLALGGVATAQPADTGVGVDQTADATNVNVSFIGTVADEGTVAVSASGVVDDGGNPVDGDNVTVTVGGQNATTATVIDGELTATFDPAILSLTPTESATVGLAGYNVTDPAEVTVVDEAVSLDEGYNLESAPQAAELVTENVSAVNVWDAANDTYDTVTDPVFDTDSRLHQGLYLTASTDSARLGYTFEAGSTNPGTVNLSTGWNFVSSNFDISTTANLTLAEDLNLDAGTVGDLTVFPGDFEGGPLAPDDTVGDYDTYWVFVGADDQPVERNIVGSAYNRDTRRAVLGAGEITLSGQILGQTGNVLAENVTAEPDDSVVVTYTNDSGAQIVAGETSVDDPLAGEGVPVTVEEPGGFPGEHTVHVVAGEVGESDIGEPVSDEIANTITAQDSAVVYNAALNITDQQFEDSTTEVVVDTSDLQPETASEYKIVVHNQTGVAPGGVGPPIGFSANLTGARTNVTVPLTLNTTTPLLTMIHFPGDPTGPPIPTLNGTDFGIGDAQAGTVTDTATVEIQQAEGGNVEFQSQVLGTNNGSAAVLAENVTSVDVVTVNDAFNPQDDFLVLTNGTSVTRPDNVIDAVQLSELNESADVALNATGATPGQHTVVLHEPNATGTGPDPDAPRTDASTGEVINATATVFDGSVSITDQQSETNTSQVTVDASDLQPETESEYKIVVHNQTGVPAGGVGPPIGFSANLTGARTNVPIQLTETLNRTTDVLTMLHFPGDPTGPPIPTLNGTDFGIGDVQAGTVTDTATVNVQRFLVSDLTPTDATVEENEPFDVSATVENIGVFDDSPTVELRLEPDGPAVEEIETSEIPSGDNATVTFENVIVNEPGEYNHTVAVGGDRVSGDLNVTDLPPGNFNVDFVGQTNETVAGKQQSFDVAVENVGGERSVQAVELDWGNGSYNTSEFVTLNASESTVATLTVQTDDDEFLGQYNVTASSLNDTDTTGARINPERVIEADQAAAGETVNVTVTGRLAAPQNASLVEKYDPAVNDSSARQPARTYNGTAFGPVPFDQQFNGNRSLLVVSAENIPETGPGTLELRYEIELPSDATAGAEFGYDAAKSLLELEGDAFDIGGDDTVTVSSGSGT